VAVEEDEEEDGVDVPRGFSVRIDGAVADGGFFL
jgi:hypothetical protein